jgi:hypothetical protein
MFIVFSDPREGVSIKQKDKERGCYLKKGTCYEWYKFEETLIIEDAITNFFGHYQMFFFCLQILFGDCTPSSGKIPTQLGQNNIGKISILGSHNIGHAKQKVYMYLCPIPNGFWNTATSQNIDLSSWDAQCYAWS